MKERLLKLLATAVLVAFVNFAFANVVFMHSHTDADGITVTHSHPYVPSQHHGHSQQSLDQIASFNASAASFQGVTSPSLDVLCPVAIRLFSVEVRSFGSACIILNPFRAPPAGIFA